MKNLIIVGAGALGRELYTWARQCEGFERDWVIKGFLDDNGHALDAFAIAEPILASVDDYEVESDDRFVCALGSPVVKKLVVEKIVAKGGVFETLIHPSVVMGERNVIGQGVLLLPHSVVTSDVVLGDFVTVNLHSTVAHDAKIGKYSQLHCHCDITGFVELGEEVLVGSHASVLPGVTVGTGSTVGAGAVVAHDYGEGFTLMGNPARPVKGKKVVSL